ncbi:MAG TPA: alpha/beta hydrolase [Candidatus Binataceae bacterium]|jgi:acetyl esterase|nr:alpha/beta hydrolase [Candidatus Binataceae bacterium]
MAKSVPATFEVDIEEVEYLRHENQPLMARIFRPRGDGPFPAIVEVHGGAWNLMDRTADDAVNTPLAKSGVVVAALEFRMPPQASYPASMADINYGIRWFKAHAADFRSRPDRVGLMGSSSGGHQVMLAGIRPHDPRYCAIPLPAGAPSVDASVRCVVMLWPVIDPLGRYRFVKQLKEAGKPYPDFVELLLKMHDRYWHDEETMAEGNPALALKRGERVALPPALYIQGAKDIVHPRADLDQFVANYRKVGGHLELELFDGEAEGFIVRRPSSDSAIRAIGKIMDFVHEQVR